MKYVLVLLLALASCVPPSDVLRRDGEAEQSVKDIVAPIVTGAKPVPTGTDLEAMRLLMQTWQIRINQKLGIRQ